MAMNRLMGNSAVPQYLKLIAAGMLSLTYLGALVIEGVYMITDQTAPAIVPLVIGTGISMALGVLHLQTGASLGESVPNPPTTITLPLPQTNAQIGGQTHNASAPTA